MHEHMDLPRVAEKVQHCWIFYPRVKSLKQDPREWKGYIDLENARKYATHAGTHTGPPVMVKPYR